MTDQDSLGSRQLKMPVPDGCSDHYVAGWALADWHVSQNGYLSEEAPDSWPADKAEGFRDRLKAERVKQGMESGSEV